MNTYFKYSIFVVLSIFLTNCGGPEKKDDELNVQYPEESKELYNFEGFSLQPYGIDALIYLPDATADIGAATEPEIIHEMDDYIWEIHVGQNFHMTIEDWGEDDAFSATIKELKEQSIYDIAFIDKEKNFAYYKKSLKAKGTDSDDEVGIDHISYHVIAQHTIDGINYIFKSNKDGHPKLIAGYMAESVKSVKPLDNPS